MRAPWPAGKPLVRCPLRGAGPLRLATASPSGPQRRGRRGRAWAPAPAPCGLHEPSARAWLEHAPAAVHESFCPGAFCDPVCAGRAERGRQRPAVPALSDFPLSTPSAILAIVPASAGARASLVALREGRTGIDVRVWGGSRVVFSSFNPAALTAANQTTKLAAVAAAAPRAGHAAATQQHSLAARLPLPGRNAAARQGANGAQCHSPPAASSVAQQRTGQSGAGGSLPRPAARALGAAQGGPSLAPRAVAAQRPPAAFGLREAFARSGVALAAATPDRTWASEGSEQGATTTTNTGARALLGPCVQAPRGPEEKASRRPHRCNGAGLPLGPAGGLKHRNAAPPQPRVQTRPATPRLQGTPRDRRPQRPELRALVDHVASGFRGPSAKPCPGPRPDRCLPSALTSSCSAGFRALPSPGTGPSPRKAWSHVRRFRRSPWARRAGVWPSFGQRCRKQTRSRVARSRPDRPARCLEGPHRPPPKRGMQLRLPTAGCGLGPSSRRSARPCRTSWPARQSADLQAPRSRAPACAVRSPRGPTCVRQAIGSAGRSRGCSGVPGKGKGAGQSQAQSLPICAAPCLTWAKPASVEPRDPPSRQRAPRHAATTWRLRRSGSQLGAGRQRSKREQPRRSSRRDDCPRNHGCVHWLRPIRARSRSPCPPSDGLCAGVLGARCQGLGGLSVGSLALVFRQRPPDVGSSSPKYLASSLAPILLRPARSENLQQRLG